MSAQPATGGAAGRISRLAPPRSTRNPRYAAWEY